MYLFLHLNLLAELHSKYLLNISYCTIKWIDKIFWKIWIHIENTQVERSHKPILWSKENDRFLMTLKNWTFYSMVLKFLNCSSLSTSLLLKYYKGKYFNKRSFDNEWKKKKKERKEREEGRKEGKHGTNIFTYVSIFGYAHIILIK